MISHKYSEVERSGAFIFCFFNEKLTLHVLTVGSHGYKHTRARLVCLVSSGTPRAAPGLPSYLSPGRPRIRARIAYPHPHSTSDRPTPQSRIASGVLSASIGGLWALSVFSII